jgi:hypothetical protein
MSVPDIQPEVRRRLDELGVDQVRHMFAFGSLPPAWTLQVTAWLAEHDVADRVAVANERAVEDRIARSGERAAWIAAYASIIGVISTIIIGVIGILVTWHH